MQPRLPRLRRPRRVPSLRQLAAPLDSVVPAASHKSQQLDSLPAPLSRLPSLLVPPVPAVFKRLSSPPPLLGLLRALLAKAILSPAPQASQPFPLVRARLTQAVALAAALATHRPLEAGAALHLDLPRSLAFPERTVLLR